MPTFLKKCPNCGKHFEVERIAEKVEERAVTVDRSRELMDQKIGPVYVPSYTDGLDESASTADDPVLAEKQVREETYKCRHCGHTWTETRE
jgi:transposase-like protein